MRTSSKQGKTNAGYSKPTAKDTDGSSLLEKELSKFKESEVGGSESKLLEEESSISVGSKSMENQKQDLLNQKSEISSSSTENQFRKEKLDKGLGKPKAGRIVIACLVGLIISVILGLICYGVYRNYIMFPRKLDIEYYGTGLCCLDNWTSDVATMKGIGDKSYINQEIDYANGNELKVNFYKKMLKTIRYDALPTTDINIYGNPLVDKEGNVVYTNSTVGEGEEVIMSCIDYNRVVLDPDIIQNMMKEADLSLDNVNYSKEVVNIFCRYMCSLEGDYLPTKKIKRIPNMIKQEGSYVMTEAEDIYIDCLLFSSKELYELIDRFSLIAGGESITPTEEWLAWNSLNTEDKIGKKEPEKYLSKQMMEKDWCGVYYLQNEYYIVDESGKVIRQSISAEIGDGTIENPAGLNTDVVTTLIQGDEEYPIKVRMVEYGVSEEAIKWLESKSVKNRGIDVTSEVQYVYYVFQVTNLSKEELHITDNSVLCDKNANISSRTGTMFGLQDSITLLPDETGVIETWNSSTSLNKKYVIWGKDFARKAEPVWFRVLAGNIDDTSENKGVSINDTREN